MRCKDSESVRIYRLEKDGQVIEGFARDCAEKAGINYKAFHSSIRSNCKAKGWTIEVVGIHHRYYQVLDGDELVMIGTLEDIAKTLHYERTSLYYPIKGKGKLGGRYTLRRIQ